VEDDYDAGRFEAEAMEKISLLFETHRIVLMAGGSGMYLDAVCKGFDELPETDAALREELTAQYREKGITVLQKLLFELDPRHYYSVDLNNPHRLIRALEVCMSTGQPYSSFRKGEVKTRPFTIIKLGLNTDREELYQRINGRVDQMMEAGLEEEVRSLAKFRHLNALQAVGYRELFACMDGEITREEAIDRIKQNTRNFAKRQLTWFRKDREITWFGPGEISRMIQHIENTCAS
jgi:tRNA dimethylallyltransferase